MRRLTQLSSVHVIIFCTYTTDSQTRGYASSLPITTSCSGQSSLTRSRSQPARSPAVFDKTRVGSLHVQPNLRASAVPGSLLCGVLNLRDSSCRSGCRPFCPSCCSLLLTSRAYRAGQVVPNVAAKLRLNVEVWLPHHGAWRRHSSRAYPHSRRGIVQFPARPATARQSTVGLAARGAPVGGRPGEGPGGSG